ncbi:hypothetical protein [Aequorivita sp. KMM 9714]|uniref:hypothetical protein n=1 Tax=Aequorivita sp. KMM 9714 TaxID=2707173 RepID=UPI0013EAB2DA|nr:hypothetical protein [Aequorivita sp. KMM 9714]NGX85147.1 hypothetical protein [Aequorivita sp. KMM 9714]
MNTTTLTVQSCGNGKFRLGVNTNDSSTIFQKRYRKVVLKIEKNRVIDTETTCGPPNDKEVLKNKKCKKGYDLYAKKIDQWIKSNHFHCYRERQPTKIEFQIIKSNSTIILKFTGNTRNNRCKCYN